MEPEMRQKTLKRNSWGPMLKPLFWQFEAILVEKMRFSLNQCRENF
jgi:hypothetical protein